MKKPKRPSATKYFFKGVFWTIFICMAAWIGTDMNKIIGHYKQANHMTEMVALSMGDLQ